MGARDEEGAALEKVTALFKTEKEKGWDEWEVLEMDVQEEIGQPTHGQLVIAATSQNFDFSPMLGKSCVLVLSRGYDRKRFFKGLVFRIEHRGEYPFGSVAKIDFATAVRALQHGQDSRVFENQTVPQILEEVFKEALEPFGREVRLNLSRPYPVREYCTQYKESDWDFVQRLMADEGITFYLDEGGKEADRETVVLVDSNDSFPEIETMGSVEEPEEPRPAGHVSGPLGLLAEMVKAAVPEVHPVLEPAKLVLVVRKKAKNPKTANLEPYTHPKRHAIKLKADAAFDGTAIFSCSKPAAVRFFTAKEGGTEVKFDGWDNVFRHGVAPKWAPGARLASGVTLYAEAVAASEAVDDITVELSLSGGSKKCGPKAVCSISNVEVFLEICAKRNSPQEDPTPLSQEDKVFVGRDLIVQDKAGTFERAQLIIRPVKPAGFKGELELRTADARLTAHRTAKKEPKESSLLPFKLAASSLGSSGQTLWVEGASVAGKASRAGLSLHVLPEDEQGDCAVLRIRRRIYLTFDDGPHPETAELLSILSEEQATATFFVNLGTLGARPKLQYEIIKRILREGHSIGNHGLRHIPTANRRAYGATTPDAVRDNFDGNRLALQRLFRDHQDKAPEFEIARLQGDGRLMPEYVEMITKKLRIPHAAWAVEYAPAEIAMKLPHLRYPIEGVSGVKASVERMPERNSIVVLMHDLHWRGREQSFRELLRKLKQNDVIVPLVPIPDDLEAGRHGTEGVVYP